MADVYVYDLLESLSLSDDDFILVNIGTGLKRIKFSVLRQLASSGLPQSDIDKINAIDIRGDGSKFLDNSGNYRLLSKDDIKDLDVTLPVASQDTLGGVKIDGTTITINEDGIISGVSAYELPVATDTTLGGVKIDNDTIKINDGTISADVIGNWSAGIYYPVGYFVVYENVLYQCINSNSDNTWTESNWSLVGGSGGKGEKGDDGFSPIATVEQTDTGCIVTITDKNGITTANIMNGINGIDGENGFSPVANVTETETGAIISITDAKGTTAVNINNGIDGKDGANGVDGISPTATVTQTETGATISITDSTGTTSTDILNGTDGNDGITPHIDESTKHWFIGDIDTGITAEGKIDINADCAQLFVTLPVDGWSDTAPYVQTILLPSISSDNVPIVDILYSEDTANWESEQQAYSCLTKITTGDGFITAICLSDKPEIDVNIKLKISGDLSSENTVSKQEFENYKADISQNYIRRLAFDGWSETEPFVQEIKIDKVTSDMFPIVDIVPSNDVELAKLEQKSWERISNANAYDGRIVFMCYGEKPEVDIYVKVKVI